MTDTRTEAKGAKRRDFLKLAGSSSAAGVSLAVGARATEAGAPTLDSQQRGYRETAHVKKAYELARF
ncbi:MAG: twin-arginine translocation signal domain-containing protein [Geminicoccaceae bacterium]